MSQINLGSSYELSWDTLRILVGCSYHSGTGPIGVEAGTGQFRLEASAGFSLSPPHVVSAHESLYSLSMSNCN